MKLSTVPIIKYNDAKHSLLKPGTDTVIRERGFSVPVRAGHNERRYRGICGHRRDTDFNLLTETRKRDLPVEGQTLSKVIIDALYEFMKCSKL